jgi:Protein of unknown function (DUF1638).
MVKGNLGAVVCPILEDELVYSLSNDGEEKNIFLLENNNNKDISIKLTRNGLKYTMLDERMFMNGMESLPENAFNIIILMKDMGLHAEPEILKDNLRETLTFMQSHVDAFVLYYGLCGNANKGLEEWTAVNLTKPVTIFRDSSGKMCDDCIGVAVGSTEKYYNLQKKYTGVLYYTPAMATKWKDFFTTNDMFRGVESKNYDRIKMVLEMCDYHDVLMVPTGLGDEKEFEDSLKEFADEFNFNIRYLEPGWVTLEPTEKIYKDAKASLTH